MKVEREGDGKGGGAMGRGREREEEGERKGGRNDYRKGRICSMKLRGRRYHAAPQLFGGCIWY